jgi:hypothetical protein
MLPTMQSGNCFNSPKLFARKMNVKSESFRQKYIKKKIQKNKSNRLIALPGAKPRGHSLHYQSMEVIGYYY